MTHQVKPVPEGFHTVTPHLVIKGAAEAIEFYKKTLGAKVEMMMRFKESPEPPQAGCMPPNSEDKIMHACMRIADTQVMASDGRCTGQPKFQGFALSINAKDEGEADRMFSALGDGGEVRMPLMKTFFSSRFGMVADKFGVDWMVIVAPETGKA